MQRNCKLFNNFQQIQHVISKNVAGSVTKLFFFLIIVTEKEAKLNLIDFIISYYYFSSYYHLININLILIAFMQTAI